MKRLAMIFAGLLLALLACFPESTQAWTRPFQGCKAHPSEVACSFSDPFVEGCSDDASLITFAFSPDNRITAGLRYSPSCQSAWTVARNDHGNADQRLRATIVSSDGYGSARDGTGSVVSEMLYVGPEQPYRSVQAIGRLFDAVTGQLLSTAQTPFVNP
jgi:hypothetical protein